jgi:hypothetical protein
MWGRCRYLTTRPIGVLLDPRGWASALVADEREQQLLAAYHVEDSAAE